MSTPTYLCIDLKSYYASVECVERGLDPMTTSLVVADAARSKGTICLAVSPALKAKGVKNRCRLHEIPNWLDYIIAPPRMQLYIDYAAKIYGVYLRYISPEDIHVYSIDEAFLDVTRYLRRYGMTGREMAVMLMDRITQEVGVRSTCGIGTNLYLAKIALDITAKHAPDFIGELTEESYCRTLWDHRPLTDFWMIGEGKSRTLAQHGITTMGQLAHADETMLYRAFGIDAELLIDHAWGRETATIADIKSYHSKSKSISSNQVLMRDYNFEEGLLVLKEMLDLMCLRLVELGAVTGAVWIYVGYSQTAQHHSSRATVPLPVMTSADGVIIPAAAESYLRIVDRGVPIRRIGYSCAVIPQAEADTGLDRQLSLFETEPGPEEEALERSLRRQQAILAIKKRYGKDAILKGMNYLSAATTRERNHQIGGHRSGQ